LGDNDQRVRSSADTVGEALLEAGIGLQGLDYSLPDPQSPVPANGIIRVVRVEEKVLLEVEPIPFETETELSDDLEIDTQGVIQPGVYGIRARRTRLRFEDGIEVSRWVESEYVAQEPESQVMGYGTKIVRRTLDTPDGEITYWRALNMYAVSYKPSSAGDNITATGAVLQKGIVAIDPNYIPYGTRMYIPGYGFGLAADTGGGVKGRLIDLGYSDEDYVSWHQWVTVYFLWPPPEFVAWIIP
jgi:3D (Asp-Asp-Asp) domain-containing protein